ncbi:uncharacterized protein LOC142597432 [Dermatophagoides farinae]|uniref:Uncharacterized protein n=1 Tax=Dermatophagoides farinae TaxID=6954 RepID=A0A922IDB6_DERFA|nr:hypothetical protein HUG17_10184 [Dermatophagoides farinae]KAH9528261.1 hypothetical protein DERF_002218 [Dermatophagoides farinae]
MPLFRQQLLTQDPRYRYIVTLCNYCLATLFLGMIVVLSGVMFITYVEQKKNQDEYDHEKISFAHKFGIILLVSGCIFLLASFIVFVVASIMYVRTRTEPPPTIETPEPSEQIETAHSAEGDILTNPA